MFNKWVNIKIIIGTKDHRGAEHNQAPLSRDTWYKEGRYDDVNHEGAARSGLSGLSLDTKSDRICQKCVTRPTMRVGSSARGFTHTLKSDRIERGTARGQAEGSPKATRASVCK